MRQERRDGPEPQRAWSAWFTAMAWVALAGLVPTSALAQPVPGETAIDDADEAAEAEAFKPATEAAPAATGDADLDRQLDEAQASIEEMERQLEEAKRQMQLMGRKVAPEPTPVPGTDVGLVQADGRAKKLQWSLNDDGTLYMRMLMWLQVWTRAIQMNPGSEVLGNSDPWYGDVALRRARLLWFGEIFPRTMIMLHIGINNQTFRNARKPQLFFHDAWAEFKVTKNKALYLGAGLIYWNGISRQTNASTITLMSLDAPIMNWPLIELEDQFARQFGIYAKGKFGLFDYRFAVTRPFTPFDVDTPVGGNLNNPITPSTTGNYRYTNAWAYAGYFQFQFKDIESNVLPYTVGTYIGAKNVLNWGFGGYAHPNGIQYVTDTATGAVKVLPLLIGSTDLFLDMPFGEKGSKDTGAVTWYGVYQYQSFGPNNVRNVGIMNPATGTSTTTIRGSGNQYQLIGTGHSLYSELGILMPGHVGEQIKFQPYVNWQGSSFQVLNDWMHHVGVGLNVFIHRHNAKITIEYRNRPIFFDAANGSGVESRKGNSFIMQWHVFI
ncbi:MAG: hypothetical protein WBM75_17325 [Polyangiales bacterium]